jgi:hypothetical protein
MERIGTNSMKPWTLEKPVVHKLVKEFLSPYAPLIFNGDFLRKSLLSSTYKGLSRRGQSDVKLTTHLHLESRSRIVELYFHFSICPHGIALN